MRESFLEATNYMSGEYDTAIFQNRNLGKAIV